MVCEIGSAFSSGRGSLLEEVCTKAVCWRLPAEFHNACFVQLLCALPAFPVNWCSTPTAPASRCCRFLTVGLIHWRPSCAGRFGKPYSLAVCAAFGGLSKQQQFKELRAGAEVAVCTPGRMIDLVKMKACSLQRVTYLVRVPGGAQPAAGHLAG